MKSAPKEYGDLEISTVKHAKYIAATLQVPTKFCFVKRIISIFTLQTFEVTLL